MRKIRPGKDSDQKNTDDACYILLRTIENYPWFEPNIWAAAFLSLFANGYVNSDIPYENFVSDIDEAKELYKKRWDHKEVNK